MNNLILTIFLFILCISCKPVQQNVFIGEIKDTITLNITDTQQSIIDTIIDTPILIDRQIYVISHSWYVVFKNHENIFEYPINYIFIKVGGNLTQATNKVKTYDFTEKYDIVVLLGLNDILNGTTYTINKFNTLISSLKDKVGTIYICNISARSNFDKEYMKNIIEFNSRTSEINAEIIDISTYLNDTDFGNSNRTARFHLNSKGEKRLAEYIKQQIEK